MVQDLSKIGIVGAGPAGCACAYFIKQYNPNVDVILIDYSTPMRTILPTGGGRCNLAYQEYDFRELVKNYPRGEKFLYSIFSRFSTSDTLEFFENLGINLYVQDDNRIFPESNSSKEVQDKFLKALNDVKVVREKALRIEKNNERFKVVTDMNSYQFDKLVYATGGHNGYEMIKRIGVSVVEPKQSLVGLVTKEKMSDLMGIVIKDVYNFETGLRGDLLFTHFGVSGPLVYKISSIKARDEFPYTLTFDFVQETLELQPILNNNPHKFIKNIVSDIVPMKLSEHILRNVGIDMDTKCHNINGAQRDSIIECLKGFQVTVKSGQKDGETVTAGGVDLNKINSKTMESKEVEGLYFCGEVIDVDGFCGGFNLQNCWSTAFVVADALTQ